MDSKQASELSSFHKFLESKSWKFYAAVAAGITLAGTGAFLLSNQQRLSMKQQYQDELVPDVTDDMYEAMSENVIGLLSAQQRLTAATSLKTKGNQAFARKKYQQAVQLYTQAIRFLADPIFYSNRAACYANLGQLDRVIADCSEALRLNPTYLKALQRRAIGYERSGDAENALFDYTSLSILEGFKNNFALEHTHRLLKAISEEKASKIVKTRAPRLPSPVYINAYFDSFRPDMHSNDLPHTIDEDSGDAYYIKARSALAQKKYYDALDYIKLAVNLECSKQVAALNLKGTLVFLEGQSDEALDTFNKALELDPNYIQIYIKKSNVYMEKGDLAAALEQIKIASNLNPLDPDIHYHLGQVHYISGHYGLAVKDYTESSRLDPTFVYTHIQLAVVQHKLGNHLTAVNMFQKISTQFPTHAEVFNYYGEVLIDQGNIQGAIDVLDKAMALDPSHPLPFINMAMILYQHLGKPDEAIQLCKSALDADPACDAAVASLAQMLIEQDRPSEALVYYERAIPLARTQPELEHAISYVEATKAQIRFAKEYPNAAAKLRTLK
ncbi:mitochondrial TOM complex subunit Tom70 [Mucor ambiguus]|uniref:Mitochondrial TOM complex subunit Tom70 n=1 Tax=Mucor ambiguus TaxID=91626 RepID=A0A0C9M4T8_9FUNG|nr:mitochondrial TOM complex subunit Tom70 [Mucor ambiguus]